LHYHLRGFFWYKLARLHKKSIKYGPLLLRDLEREKHSPNTNLRCGSNPNSRHTFIGVPNLRRGDKPNKELTLGVLGTPQMWQGANVRRGTLHVQPNTPLLCRSVFMFLSPLDAAQVY
jgi:hypothetical protein